MGSIFLYYLNDTCACVIRVCLRRSSFWRRCRGLIFLELLILKLSNLLVSNFLCFLSAIFISFFCFQVIEKMEHFERLRALLEEDTPQMREK